jgi:predicted  nucleic acid-binding Zn-ribbon protein
MNVRDIVENLVALQGIDSAARNDKNERDGLQKKIQRLKELLVVAGKGLDEKREKLAEASRWYRDKDSELKADQEKVNRAKSKLQAVTKNKEYMAMQKEIELLRKANTNKEEEILKLLNVMEEFKLAIAAEQEKISALEADVNAEEARNATRIGELDARIAARNAERDAIAAKLAPDLVSRYKRIQSARDGLAIVPVRNQACSGCNFSVPPQQILRLQKLESMETCRNCSRILYWDAKVETAVAE